MRGFLAFIGRWFKNASDAPVGGDAKPAPTVRHIPADGVIPDGWVLVRNAFRYQNQPEDAMVLPGKSICIDALRPGEWIDLSVMIREPFQRARTPGASGEGCN